ncbi:MAG: TonB-dependent receptor [Bacteroides sp.]|nr:TonB-dependent receptor [Bacteroides sp.]
MRKISLRGLFCPKSLILKQILLTMKITLFLLLFVTFQAYSSNSYSQNKNVTIPHSTLKIKDVPSKIESQTDYMFVYNKKSVDVNRTVKIQTEQQAVSDLLNEIFDGTAITYLMEGNNIVLTRTDENNSIRQNQITVRGVVTDTQGEPIIGANVLEKGTTNGTITDMNGRFTLEVSAQSSLLITYIGYASQTIALHGKTDIVVRMQEEALMLQSVVVTAMGIKKKEASLTYSTQQVGGDELVRAKDPNLINTLAGKTAGVQITKSSSGLGGSAKVSIRGSRSISGNNQPLYVIGGVPMLNGSNEQAATAIGGTADAGNRDGGDGISNLNPDDIESMSILKGASAAALYGSQAANGVILITTKSGKAGVQRVTFSSNLTVDQAISLPKFQNNYAMDPNSRNSWGEKKALKDYKNADKFFQNGLTAINSVSFTTGNEKMQTYFSYANTSAKGIIEKNNMQKHNLNIRETANFFNDYLKLDGNVNLMTQTLKNRPTSGGYYMNPLVGLYGFPRGEDLGEYKRDFEVYNPDRNMNIQNWYVSSQDFEQNPYWITNRINSNDKRTRMIASLTANVKITDWLNVQARGTADYTHDQYNQKMYASTAPSLSGMNGRYIDLNHTESLYYGDVMAMVNKTWNDFSLNGAIGTSINSTNINSLRLDSKTASLYYPNVFTVANIVMDRSAYIDERINEKRILQSVFATAQVGWKESLYLDVTGRNDWSSTLAYTNHNSFFYPSVGLSWVLNNTVNLPDWISFGKFRGSWSKVGNDLPLFISNSIAGSNDIIGAGGAIVSYAKAPFNELKPEMSTSYEIGTEWKFFNYRVDLDFTYYRTNTRNQLFTLPSSAGADFKYYMVNAGNIQNQGVELTLGVTPVMTENFRWKTQFNFSSNKNKIIELHPDLRTFLYGDEGFSSSYAMRLVEGGSFGDIYGKAFERDANGKIVFLTDSDGDKIPSVIGGGNTEKVGNSMPDFMLGWSNTFTYKNLSLYFLIDGRFGGDVLSQTQAELDQRGVSQKSGDVRNAGYVDLEGTQLNPRKFYTAVSGRDGCTEYYMYSATNIRLRELSLGYSLPKEWLHKTGVFHDVQLSLVGRNLFFLSKKAPFDPDAVLSTGNDNQGVDVFGMPTTRSLGFNIKLTF